MVREPSSFLWIVAPLCPLLISVAGEHRGVKVKGVLSDSLPVYEGSGESPGYFTELFRYLLGAYLSPKPGEGA